MKHLIIAFLFFFSFGYAQNSTNIFFKLDSSIAPDSIVFQDKALDKFNNTLKFKRKKKIRFSVYKNGKKHDFKIPTNSLGLINVLSIKPVSNNKTNLVIERGHTYLISTIDDTCMENCFELKIKTYNFRVNNNRIETGNEELDKEISDSNNFYF